MFTSCCATNHSPKNEAEKPHFNPIYLKLGGKKAKAKNKETQSKANQTCITKQSIIYGCTLSNLQETSKHIRTGSDLVQSICLRTNQDGNKSHIQAEKVKTEMDDSVTKSLQKQLKLSRLQEKYIKVLERTNQYLQKALNQKEHTIDDQHKIKYHSERKVRTELQELKNRLNNIDLSCINKLAKHKIKQQHDKSCLKGKQNVNRFKEPRQKFQ